MENSKSRNIVVWILLSIVTCGIASFVWIANLNNDYRELAGVLPLLGVVLISGYVKNSWVIKKKWETVCLWISLIVLLSYGFLRNLPILIDFCENFIHI